MEPPTKYTVSKKYGFTSVYDKYYKDVENSTLHETFDDLSFLLNRDFYIRDTNTDQNWKVGKNTLLQKNPDDNTIVNKTFDVQPIRLVE